MSAVYKYTSKYSSTVAEYSIVNAVRGEANKYPRKQHTWFLILEDLIVWIPRSVLHPTDPFLRSSSEGAAVSRTESNGTSLFRKRSTTQGHRHTAILKATTQKPTQLVFACVFANHCCEFPPVLKSLSRSGSQVLSADHTTTTLKMVIEQPFTLTILRNR